MKLGAMVAVSSFALSQVAAGQAVQWKVSEGGNGHWYGLRPVDYSQSWESAVTTGVEQGATLVILDSIEEVSWVSLHLVVDLAGVGALIGAEHTQVTPGVWQWRWLDGTLVESAAWCLNAPSGPADQERWLYMNDQANAYPGSPAGCIDDYPWNSWGATWVKTMVLEWSDDCNNDGIVDYGQCRDGSLPDYNGNNIPDCCEQGAPCVVGNYPMQWRIEEGGNGHWYRLKVSAQALCWPAIASEARALGGYLATETSSQEHVFIGGALVDNESAWTGRYGPFIGAERVNGSWTWMTGEPWSFSSWYPGEPNGGENRVCYIAIGEGGGCGRTTNWNDEDDCASMNPTPCDQGVKTYIVEWSADCNNDGIVDYGQILLGQLADVDTNGVPDLCEAYEVPGEFSTIQAAINAVPAGQYGLVLVAAGTRNESFSLNGKNVRVQGAPNNATILDGTGLTTSIARFTGGEPATAGLANLVFRNGTAGSRITPKSTFTVGGAVYGVSSAASITRCRFEHNRADYGGGMYLLYSSMNLVDCDFVGNVAEGEGGGALVYETSGSLVGCDFTQNTCGLNGPGSGSGFKAVGARIAGETVLLSSCTFTGGIAGVDGSAVEYNENIANTRGKLRMVACTVTGNSSGLDAAGLRMIGTQSSCILTGGTTICTNAPRNADGPFLIEGDATVCGCLADVTGDGQVNGSDLGIVLNSWGGADALGSGDVNHDGVIDGSDLSIVLSNWGACGN